MGRASISRILGLYCVTLANNFSIAKAAKFINAIW